MLFNICGFFGKFIKFLNQSQADHDKLRTIHAGLFGYIILDILELSSLVFFGYSHKIPKYLCTRIVQIFHKQIHINNKNKKGLISADIAVVYLGHALVD